MLRSKPQGDGALELSEVELVIKSPSFWTNILGTEEEQKTDFTSEVSDFATCGLDPDGDRKLSFQELTQVSHAMNRRCADMFFIKSFTSEPTGDSLEDMAPQDLRILAKSNFFDPDAETKVPTDLTKLAWTEVMYKGCAKDTGGFKCSKFPA